MKKILILLVSLLVIGSIIYWMQGSETEQSRKNEETSQEPEQEITQEVASTSDLTVSVEKGTAKKEEPVAEKSQVANIYPAFRDCADKVDQKYPGMDIELYKVTSELYADGEMAAGISPYQTMPTASLKSLAEADDVDALFVLGIETVWLATTGLMINQHSDLPKLSGEERSEIAKSHKLDLELLEQGEEYLFRVATLGKVGGLGEYASLASLGMKRLSEDTDEQKVQELIAKILAYSELAHEVHREDGIMQEIMKSQLKSVQRKAFEPFVERDDFKTFKANVQERADYEFEELFSRWKERREYYGLPTHPKFITDDLVEYSEAMEACHKLLN
ncbi:hypothetical protein [Kangiella koreensis]|uniref:Uncharacterized protein n=1 Tax=Kangiella koreensis (strain DSM 16069 / JCM 12317 / KCTC 12182 / SW-125) TaxID=523791 RepID=C7R8Z2_KANKD|nr:hypothetical protein [Kangiella koreensis]ACV26005.1 hypothetical protein Kkor_0585 [Kangiella koreensis DSM 16069]